MENLLAKLAGLALASAACWSGAMETTHGWGHGTVGGQGGKLLMVTRLDDDVKKPAPGTLRWALLQTGPRVVRFAVAGEIRLRDRIVVKAGRLTVDGRNAPGDGICVRGGSLEFIGCEQVILTHLRVRLGDETVLKKLKADKLKRPRGSTGLDCISLHECRKVVLDHLSLSWSCDELLSVVRCQGVSVQWCLLSEPLGHPRLHPYGDNHAYALNASASTLSVHHCVLAHYWMRGPQFEANDTRRGDRWPVRMEAMANVMFDFHRSGLRYTAGVEDHKTEARGKSFEFQLAGNVFIDSADVGRCIETITKHGTHPGVKVWVEDNWLLRNSRAFDPAISQVLENGQPLEKAPLSLRRQRVKAPLFASPNPPPLDLGGEGLARLLNEVGAGPRRDAVDRRVIGNLLAGRSRPILRSPQEVGGWPRLDAD